MGVKEFLPKPIDVDALKEAIDRVTVTRVETTTQGRLITVVGSSGGVGTTMITTNLAAELAALTEGKVSVVDLDYRYGQVATLLDVDPKYTLADLCGSPEALEPQVVARALADHSSGVQVLARPNHLAEADTITAAACMGVFSNLIQLSDYVISDGPTRFDVSGKSVLALSDMTLLIVQALVPCVRNARRIIQSMRDNGYNLERAHLICNRIGRGSGHLSVDDVTESLGLNLFATIPDDWDVASGAINLGEPLLSYSPKSKLRIAIQEIAERLYAPDFQADERGVPKHGLIGRIFAGN
jgi:pilus assembly protein CpaE